MLGKLRAPLTMLVLLAVLIPAATLLVLSPPTCNSQRAFDEPRLSQAASGGSSGVVRPALRPLSPQNEPSEAPRSSGGVSAVSTRIVRVRVVEHEAGESISGAHVRLEPGELTDAEAEALEQQTDQGGVATLSAPDGLGWQLVVWKDGFLVQTRDLRRGEVQECVALRRGIPLAGRVVFADSREPALGVAVRAWSTDVNGENPSHDIDREQRTNADGHFEFAAVPAERPFTVYAKLDGYETARSTLVLGARRPDIEIILGDGGVLEGTVYSADGQAEPAVEVTLQESDASRRSAELSEYHYARTRVMLQEFTTSRTRTDAAGHYTVRLAGVPGGARSVRRQLVARDTAGHEAIVDLGDAETPGGSRRCDIRFRALSCVQLKLGSPPSKTLVARLEYESGVERRRTIDAGTREVEFPEVPGGEATLVIAASEPLGARWAVHQDVRVPWESTLDIIVSMDIDASVTGIVVDDSGEAVAGARLTMRGLDPEGRRVEASALTTADGKFTLVGPSLPRGELVAEPPSHDSMGQRQQTLMPCRVEGVAPSIAPMRLVLQRCAQVTGKLSPRPTQGTVRLWAVWNQRKDNVIVDFDGDGRFAVAAPFIGESMTMYIKCEGYAPCVFENVALGVGGALELGEVRLIDGETVKGVLVDAEGHPLRPFRLMAMDPWIYGPIDVDNLGRFEIANVPLRPAHLTVMQDANRAARPDWRVVVEPGARNVRFEIGPSAIISGRVQLQRGGAARSRVVCFVAGPSEPQGPASRTARTDETGAFTTQLQSGRWRVLLVDPESGKATDMTEIEARPGRNPDLELEGDR